MSAPTLPTPGPSPARRPRLADRLALWVVRLAKLRRQELDSLGPADYERFYERFFEDKDVEAYEADRRMVVRRQTIADAVRAHVPPGGTILDAGCGLGDVLAGLPDGYRLAGFDYASGNVRIAGRRLRGRAGVVRGSIYETPYPTGAFDACLCLEVLEHIEDDARAARELARVLKPGGVLIAAVPYTYYWPDYFKLMGHFRHYTRETFTALLEGAGLRVEAHLPNYPNFHQSYTRRYAMTRAWSMTAGRLMGRPTLYKFRWPWRRRTALAVLADRLEPLRRRDAALDYAREPTSTFLLARKPG